MQTLVIYCHPWEGSFNHAVLEAVERRLEHEGAGYQVIDLYADGFVPALSREELAGYNEGRVLDSLVERYQKLVAAAERLVIVTPIWWNDVPAMLRGFVDHIASCDLYTTSAEPTEHLELALRSSFIEGTLAQLGIGGLPEQGADVTKPTSNRRWHNFGLMDASAPAQREAWLRAIESGEAL